MKKISDYYLTEQDNILLVCSIIAISMYCAISSADNSEILSFLAFIISFGIFNYSYIIKLFSPNKDVKSESTPYSELLIDRKNVFKQIKNKFGLVILTGKSGTGKSCLLRQLFDDEKDENIFFITNNYFMNWNKRDLIGKRYIVLDQFERAFAASGFKQKIKLIQELSKQPYCLIIISLKQEYFGDLYNLLKNEINPNNIQWLKFNTAEYRPVFEKILDACAFNLNEIRRNLDRYPLLKKLKIDIENSSVTFIQVSLIIKFFQEETYCIVENEWERLNRSYDLLISSYLKRVLERLTHPDLAYIILDLLCKDIHGVLINTIIDFQNISFQTVQTIEKTLNDLLELKLIRKVQDGKGVFSSSSDEYEISHEYLQDLIQGLCRKSIASDINNNIAFYSTNLQRKRSDQLDVSSVAVHSINEKYKNYISNKHYLEYFFLFITLLIDIIIISYLLKSFSVDSTYSNPYYYFSLATIYFIVGLSRFYIYNYYKYFLIIFNKRYLYSVIIGMFCCWSSFIFRDYWAVGPGIEVLIIGISTLSLKAETRLSEKSFFRNRAIVVILIGYITIILGVFFISYSRYNIILSIPLFFLYIIYMGSAIFNHINKQHFLSLLGKILFRD